MTSTDTRNVFAVIFFISSLGAHQIRRCILTWLSLRSLFMSCRSGLHLMISRRHFGNN